MNHAKFQQRLILLGRYRFTRKAEEGRLRDGLLQTDVLESIINASGIKKWRCQWLLTGGFKVAILILK